MIDFKKLRVWEQGMRIAIATYRLTDTFPAKEKYSLCTQMTSAAVSIPSNIAEGNTRRSDKDKSRFAEIALGSSFELETQLLIADDLNFGDIDLRKNLIEQVLIEHRMLNSFLSTLKK